MDFCAIMTVWNFAARIEFVADRALSLFDRLIVLDNDSTDGSGDILKRLARKGRVEYYHSGPKTGRTAGKDANFLLEKASAHAPMWVVKLDHDEYYEDALSDELERILSLPERFGWVRSYRATLWRGGASYRVDGRYRWLCEHTMFRWRDGLSYPEDAVHHLERVPAALGSMKSYRTGARLVHVSQVDEARVRLQVERLKEFDRDWSESLLVRRVKVRPFEEKLRTRG
jgi:glycosyltransferase involved in cell wall biosynthesis